MKQFLSALLVMGACMTIGMPHASAQESAAAPSKKTAKKSTKKTSRKASSKKATAKAKQAAPLSEDEREPDVSNATGIDYQCELGNKLTIYKNASDDQHIGLRWNKHLSNMTRVSTSTGADRFENRMHGLVWIGIPAKGMLLDSKKGLQLANECKSPDQLKAEAAKTSAEPAPAAAPASAAAPEAPKQ